MPKTNRKSLWKNIAAAIERWKSAPDPDRQLFSHIPTALLDARWHDKVTEQYPTYTGNQKGIYSFYWAEEQPPATSGLASTAYDSAILHISLDRNYPFVLVTPREAPWLSSVNVPCHLPGMTKLDLGKELNKKYYAYCFDETEDVVLPLVTGLVSRYEWSDSISIEIDADQLFICARRAMGPFHGSGKGDTQNEKWVKRKAPSILKYLSAVRYTDQRERVDSIAAAAIELRNERYEWRMSQF